MSNENNYGPGDSNTQQPGYDPNQQQPQQPSYDPNQYQQPQQPGYDPNQYQQPQQPGYDPNQYQQPQPGYDPNQYQQPQQPGYDPNQQPYGGPEVAAKKSNKLPIIIISLVVVAALAVGAFFLLRDKGGNSEPGVIGGISRSQDPEQYLQAAIDQTGTTVEEQSSTMFPDFNRFSGQPSEVSVFLDFVTVPDSPEIEGTRADLILKSAENKALIEMSLNVMGINLNNNQLYIADDMIALSVPDLYTRHKYITVDPNTLVEDWNGSMWGMYSPLPEDTLEQFTGLFDMGDTEGLTESAETMVNKWAAASDTYFTDFKDEDTVKLDINGTSVEAAKMSYTISSANATDYLIELAEAVRAYYADYVGYLSELGGEYSSVEYEMDAFVEELRNLQFPDGIKFYYYVDLDTGTICRMALESVKLSHASYPSEVITLDFDVSVTSSYVGCHINVGDGIDIYSLNMDADLLEGETTGMKMSITAAENNNQVMDMAFDMTWNSSNKDFNLSLDMTAEDSYGKESVGLALTGKLSDSDDAVSLEDGSFVMTSNGSELLNIGLGLGVRAISESDISIDTSQAVSLFDIDLMELMEDLDAGINSLMGY